MKRKLANLFSDMEPEDQLTVEVFRYSKTQWQLRFLCTGESYDGVRYAGSITLSNKDWAEQIAMAIGNIDKSFHIDVRIK